MRRSKIALLAAVSALAGCAQQPHNNVLLFGTDTKVALDVSTSATSGGAPQVTLGYRRAEAVWMPLVVNDRVCDSSGDCQTQTARSSGPNGVEPLVLQGEDFRTKGGRDSYSVFASFGAKFSGDATGAGANAQGGLAQFFATGLAAQRLASNPGVEQVLKVANPNDTLAAANALSAEADAASVTAQADAALGAERKEAVKTAITLDTARKSLLQACLPADSGKRTNLQSKIPASEVTRNPDLDQTTIQGLTSAAAIESWWRTLESRDKSIVMTAQAGVC